tara:strand:- start:323 stop:1504 length:1182 start_codon:yes stop_codon:yes gene_type:complete
MDITNKNYDLLLKAVDNINRTEWYYNQDVLKKFQTRGNFTLTEINKIEVVTEIMKELYKDRFHLELELMTSVDLNALYFFQLKLIVHYPKVKIMNEKGGEMVIKNHFQFIHLMISDNKIYPLSKLSTLTVNPTMQQYVRKYAHSHISSCYYLSLDNSIKQFCLGSSTEFRTLAQSLSIGGELDYDTFYMFAMNLTTVAQTESLAGKPHIKLETISLDSELSEIYVRNYTYTTDYERGHKSGGLSPIEYSPVNWRINSGIFEIIDDYKLEKHCLIYGNDSNLYDRSNIVCKDSSGNYYQFTTGEYAEEVSETLNSISWAYKFKDKEYHFAIAEGAALRNDKFYIHPKTKNYVKKHLESRANIHYIKNCIKAKFENNQQKSNNTVENQQADIKQN